MHVILVVRLRRHQPTRDWSGVTPTSPAERISRTSGRHR
jgi:hypothetical protein